MIVEGRGTGRGSYNVVDDPTADYEILVVSKDSIDKQTKRVST